MRPSILYPLFAPIETLNGIGKSYSRLLNNLCGNKVIDLLKHFPSSLIDRRCTVKLNMAENGKIWTGKIRVVEHYPPKTKKQPYRIIVEDETDQLILVFFKIYQQTITQQFPVGSEKIISGKIEIFNNSLTMNHPDYVVNSNNHEKLPLIEPVYPLTAGITNKMLYKLIQQALVRIPDLPEWLDENLINKYNWPSYNDAVFILHNPQNISYLAPNFPARQRLAYDELLANQLSLAIVRAKMKHQKGRSISGNGLYAKNCWKILILN